MIGSALAAAVLATGASSQAAASDHLAGAALCVAALEYPGAAPGEANAVDEGVRGWRRVMVGVNSDVSLHQPAIDRARRALDDAEARRTGMGLVSAQATLNAMECASQTVQARYLARFASPETRAQLQGEAAND